MWNLRNNTNNLFTKHTKFMAIKAPFGGIDWEFGINWYTLPYIKQIKNKGLLYRTGKYIQCLVITYNGKESEKNIHVTLLYTWN